MDRIKSRARKARTALKEALDTTLSAAEPFQQDLREAQDNFLLWAVNLGVFDSGHSNLDYRLQEVPEATELIKDLLEDLVENAEALVAVAPGEDPDAAGEAAKPADDDENGSLTEASEDDIDETEARILSLKDIMLRLFRLARSIRNYSTRSAQGHRDVYSTYPSEQRQAIIDYLVDHERLRITDYIVHCRKHSHMDLASARTCALVEQISNESSPDQGQPEQTCDAELDGEDQALVSRLAKASSRRRQQFVYWRYRHDRSAMATELDEDEDQEKAVKPEEAHVPPKADRLDPLTEHPQALSMPSSATKLRREQINLAERVSVASGISRPPSARGPGGAPVGWPSVPEGLPEGAYFNCPYCYNLCPDRYRSSIGWKSHLMHDLKPYCCTYPHCESGDQLYDSWADWTSHEMLVHNKVWTCLEHPDEEFHTPELYHEHVRDAHPEEAEHMRTPEVVSARATGSMWSGRDCPFCFASYEHARELHRHIAWHLESIALGALPRSTGLEKGSQEGIDRNSAAQDFGDADSRAGQLSDLSLPDDKEENPAIFFQPIQQILDEIKATTKSVHFDSQWRVLSDLLEIVGDFLMGASGILAYFNLEHGSREERMWNYVATYWPVENISGRDLHSMYWSNVGYAESEADPVTAGGVLDVEADDLRAPNATESDPEFYQDITEDDEYACPDCGKQYRLLDQFERHLEDTRHTAGRPLREATLAELRETTRPVKKMHELELRFCQSVLDDLMPPAKWPIDHLGTALVIIQDDLENGLYEKAQDFEDVVRNVFKNCYQDNPEGGRVSQAAHELEQIFDDRWAEKDEWIEFRKRESESRPIYTEYGESDLESEDNAADRDAMQRTQHETESEFHHEDEEWAAQEGNFIRYYMDENKTLKEATQCMVDNHGFHATPRQWAQKIYGRGVVKTIRPPNIPTPVQDTGRPSIPAELTIQSTDKTQDHVQRNEPVRADETIERFPYPVQASVLAGPNARDPSYSLHVGCQLSDGRLFELSRSALDLATMQESLLQAFPTEAGKNHQVPTLPPPSRLDDSNERHGYALVINEYFQELLSTPPYISRSKPVREFFRPRPGLDSEISAGERRAVEESGTLQRARSPSHGRSQGPATTVDDLLTSGSDEEDLVSFPVLSEVITQMAFYFSIENLSKDLYLRKNMDSQGWVFLSVMANFKRIKQVTDEHQTLETLRMACGHAADNLEYMRGPDGVERVRRRSGWKPFVLPMHERLPGAQNDGPDAIPPDDLSSQQLGDSGRSQGVAPSEHQIHESLQDDRRWSDPPGHGRGAGIQNEEYTLLRQDMEPKGQEDFQRGDDRIKSPSIQFHERLGDSYIPLPRKMLGKSPSLGEEEDEGDQEWKERRRRR